MTADALRAAPTLREAAQRMLDAIDRTSAVTTAGQWHKVHAAYSGLKAALAHPPEAELPDEGELEAWRSTADELLRTNQPHAPTLRRAAHLLQNAYLFASKLAAHPPEGAQPHHWLVTDTWFPSEPAVICASQEAADAFDRKDVHDDLPIKKRYTVTPYYAAGALHAPSASSSAASDSTAQGPACTQQPRTAVAPVAVDPTERFGIEDCAQICEGLAYLYFSGGGGPPHERFWQAARKMRAGERWSLGRYKEDGSIIETSPLDEALRSNGPKPK